MKNSVCIVATLRDEHRFIDEWLVYHRLLGVSHFFLYDDDARQSLGHYLKDYTYVTVIPWYNKNYNKKARNRQTDAYLHAVSHFTGNFEWVAFIDGDEFIVLREKSDIQQYLGSFPKHISSVSLNWHIFGHNGFFDDPEGLITSSLIRRKKQPSMHVKSISRHSAIEYIDSVHMCRLKHHSYHVDANGINFRSLLYPERTSKAHINHYQCRSFSTWMRRAANGNAHDGEPGHEWRTNEKDCLRQFVTTVALDKNEYHDDYMLNFQNAIMTYTDDIRKQRALTLDIEI